MYTNVISFNISYIDNRLHQLRIFIFQCTEDSINLDFFCILSLIFQETTYYNQIFKLNIKISELFILGNKIRLYCTIWISIIHRQIINDTLLLASKSCPWSSSCSNTNPHIPEWGEVCVEPSSMYLPLPKKIILKIKIKLCYLQYAIVAYSDFFINFNIFSWIYDFCYNYITNLMLNFCYFSSNVMSFMSLMFASFLRFLS